MEDHTSEWSNWRDGPAPKHVPFYYDIEERELVLRSDYEALEARCREMVAWQTDQVRLNEKTSSLIRELHADKKSAEAHAQKLTEALERSASIMRSYERLGYGDEVYMDELCRSIRAAEAALALTPTSALAAVRDDEWRNLAVEIDAEWRKNGAMNCTHVCALILSKKRSQPAFVCDSEAEPNMKRRVAVVDHSNTSILAAAIRARKETGE